MHTHSHPLPLNALVDVPSTVACKMALDADGAKLLAYAVSNHYWYQVFVDELPVWGMVGEIVAVSRKPQVIQHSAPFALSTTLVFS